MYWILFIGIALISYLVQANLNSKFEKYLKVPLGSGMTGREVAEKMLHDNGIYNVKVTCTPGFLTDHYDPRNGTVNLSQRVYHSNSVAAAAVAAHECGHAVQHAVAYGPLTLRSALVPVVSFASNWVQWILLAGILMVNVMPSILLVGITCINNLTTSVMINNGSIETTLKALDAKTQSTALDSIKALWTTAPYEFYLAGVERIFAIAIQIALSMLMYTAIRYGKKWLIALAFEIHFMVDFVTVLAGNFLDDIVMELLIGILVAMISYATYRIWKRCSTEQQA